MTLPGNHDRQWQIKKAANWYFWMWLWPLIPLLWRVVLRVNYFPDFIIFILAHILPHLILLIPARNKESEYVRWHGRQMLLMAGIFTISYLILLFNTYSIWGLLLPAISIWFFCTWWGHRQATRGECALARWAGHEQILPPS